MAMKQKKSAIDISYEEAYKQHLRQHKENITKAGFKIIPEKQFNRKDRTQEFYKIYERQFKNSLMMKHGHKIASLQVQQEDLALYCYSLLQSEANFPIKIFTIDHSQKNKHLIRILPVEKIYGCRHIYLYQVQQVRHVINTNSKLKFMTFLTSIYQNSQDNS